jgi:cobalamin biosynthesis Mg chelatase CobN
VTVASDRSRSGPRGRRRRRLGWGLLSFGIAGLVLVAAAAALVLGSLAAVDDAAMGFERQRAELVAMLKPAASAMSNAADSASHASASLTAASDASRRAADLTNRLAASFDSMARLGSFEIFGSRPFAGLTSQFSDTASQSRALSTDLSSTADALATNVADSQAVAADLQSLADRLEQLETSAGGSSSGGTSASLPIGLAKVVLLGLLVWFAIPAIASTWLGWRLLQSRSWSPFRG